MHLASGVVSAAGGQYRLCWCAGSQTCELAEDFRTDAGGLLLIGPAIQTQDRTCVSGQLCAFGGFLGQSLSETDAIAVLDTCGTVHHVPRFPIQGLVSSMGSSGSIVTFGTAYVTAAGGKYRLCWC